MEIITSIASFLTGHNKIIKSVHLDGNCITSGHFIRDLKKFFKKGVFFLGSNTVSVIIIDMTEQGLRVHDGNRCLQQITF